jgi:hypothetical protein
LIPFGKYPEKLNVVLINQEFAELSNFERLSESYKLLSWINADPESMLIGNIA